MSMKTSLNVWFTLALVLACTTVIASVVAVYYYMSFSTLEKRYANTLAALNSLAYTVRILIKYGNGSSVWYNQTLIPIGWSLLQATNKTTGGKVLGQRYSIGTFVTAINGVPGNGPQYWIAYSWNGTEWVPLETPTELYILRQGEIVAWYLTDDWSKSP
jgi:hypothetical protein